MLLMILKNYSCDGTVAYVELSMCDNTLTDLAGPGIEQKTFRPSKINQQL